MKCVIPGSVVTKCDEFVSNFNNFNDSVVMGNIFHNKNWKETEAELVKITDRIFGTLGEIWNNPAFSTNTAHRNIGMSEMRMGKKPDIMSLLKQNEKNIELLYTESSHVICSNSKKDDDEVKLWRETLDGTSFIGLSCRPTSNQFGIVGIQVASTVMRLNILVKDPAGIPRYFHLDHTKIPLSPHTIHTRSLVRLLLTLRNVMIVNKSLLVQALEQAISHPPRNPQLSPTVSSPPHNKY
ncbi:hypothetical protein Glove_349g29 [Diversispora epigaea]|uniref:Uncharacterized protein n=1 Tax=Diversispora epigaea TaxID=1348612 RepID=A0A397HLA5_9GLOM|nr:hypothetical protein Glove_349g29 [Diversispora epigaea]